MTTPAGGDLLTQGSQYEVGALVDETRANLSDTTTRLLETDTSPYEVGDLLDETRAFLRETTARLTNDSVSGSAGDPLLELLQAAVPQGGMNLSTADIEEQLDAIADALGQLEIDSTDGAFASELNRVEGMLRSALADGNVSTGELEAIADEIGALAGAAPDPAQAEALNELEGQLRELIDEQMGAELDNIADSLGTLANEAEDPELASQLNELESAVRALGPDATPEEIDEVADQVGEAAINADDPALAEQLNQIESQLRALANGTAQPSPTGEAPTSEPEPTQPEPEPSNLSVDGNNVDTGRYEIRASRDEVIIHDRETDTEIRAWGDPHLHTSDGDKAQFHTDPVTIDLQDGTKVTITPTEMNDEGLAFIDEVAVTQGDDAVVMSGINTDEITNSGVMEGQADQVDRQFEDGTVLEAGQEIDDLYFTDDEGNRLEELVGEDPTQRFNEHMLDGRGGASDLGVGSETGDDLPAFLDGIADQLGELAMAATDQQWAGQLNEIEQAVREEIAGDETTPASLEELADDVGQLATESTDPAEAAILNGIENQLRQRAQLQAAQAVDAVADGLGQLAMDAEDPAIAADLNALESDVRALTDNPTDAAAIDSVADQIGELVLALSDNALASQLNTFESQLRALSQ